MQPIENNLYHNHGPKSLSAKMIRGLVVPLIILVATGASFGLQNTELAFAIESLLNINLLAYLVSGGVIIAVAMGLIQALTAWLKYKNTAFMLSDNALYIRTGILERNETSIPLRHIQNIVQRQGIIDRMLGVCSCIIEIQDDEVSTTGAPHTTGDVMLADVDMNLVLPLREAILMRANTQRMVMVNHS